ncbi:MAG TPA: glycosyltransferase family 4 protein [Longimicrobium sp.]|nr:glycosyltransferase family 4 protein [Longimicrobium sp.]
MRAIHLSAFRDPRGRGGAELLRAWPTLTDVAAAAAGAGVEVQVVQAGWRDETIEAAGVLVHFVSEQGARILPRRLSTALPVRLMARVRALRPDVIHFQGLGFPAAARMAASLGVPVLVQDHMDRVPRPSRRALYRWGYARTAGVAFTDAAMARPFVGAGVLRAETPVFEVLESSTHFTPGDPDTARAAAGIHGAPCLLWIGRMTEAKDPFTVLDAFEHAAPWLADARLWMAYGDAPLLPAVRARIEASPTLRERVRLLGRVPHERVQELLRGADLYLSASRREGSGYALLEALASGAVPLVTDIPAHRRITRGGAVGGLYPCGDAPALAALLAEHAGRPRAAERKRAREHFDRHLSFAVVGRELADAYARLVTR